jgi:hypothetical protein
VFSYTCIILCNANVNHTTNGSWGLGFNVSFFKVKCDFQAKKIANFFKSILYNKNTVVNKTAILLKEVNIFKIGMQQRKKRI